MDIDDLKIAIGVLILFASLLTMITVSVFYFERASCTARWNGTFDTQFNLYSKCRIFVDGKWIPEKNYREMDAPSIKREPSSIGRA